MESFENREDGSGDEYGGKGGYGSDGGGGDDDVGREKELFSATYNQGWADGRWEGHNNAKGEGLAGAEDGGVRNVHHRQDEDHGAFEILGDGQKGTRGVDGGGGDHASRAEHPRPSARETDPSHHHTTTIAQSPPPARELAPSEART